MRFNFDPTQVDAGGGFEVLPKDSYEFSIKSVKPFVNKNPDDTVKNHGVGILLEVQGGEYNGKKQYTRLYGHTPGAQGFAKQFVMAAYGYTNQAEFNEEFKTKDWAYDADEQYLGEVWKDMTGRRITGELDVQMGQGDYANQQQQKFVSWRPI